MPAPESVDPGASPGLFSSLRSFWGVLVAILYTRLDLATTEIEEIGTYAIRLLIVGLAALIGIAMTVFFFLFFIVALFWDHRVLALGIVAIVCILGSAILILTARRMIIDRPKFLAQTLAEMRRDVEGLRAAAEAPKSSEPKP